MTGLRATVLAALALLLPVDFALAHHGTAGFYDQKKKFRIEGVAKQFMWRNPHCGLLLDGKDAAGNPVTYTLEMGSPNTLARMGYSRLSIKPGDKVMVQAHIAFSNPLAGEAEGRYIEVNGKQVATSNAEEEDAP
jgi:hypothetical protein